jgi:hypothetical protein
MVNNSVHKGVTQKLWKHFQIVKTCHDPLLLTLLVPNDVDLRFAVFLLWAKRHRSTSKYLNFPPYDVIGIKLKSLISATNTAI